MLSFKRKCQDEASEVVQKALEPMENAPNAEEKLHIGGRMCRVAEMVCQRTWVAYVCVVCFCLFNCEVQEPLENHGEELSRTKVFRSMLLFSPWRL